MNTEIFAETLRLSIQWLSLTDNVFMLKLLNTPGWLTFIGDRNVHSADDATAYIQKILSNSNINYWVVKLKENSQPVGIISFIKREHLEHPDLGFAFIPNFNNKGYAFEAAEAVLQKLTKENHKHILAVTIPGNTNSVKLLKKLGFVFDKEMQTEKETLHLYRLDIE